MAVAYVDGDEPLFVSGDSGGGIFVWSTCIPFEKEPLKKWYELKDWPYTGIHALTTSGNEYLYTGSGDKTIKAWSLEDGTLVCTMSGHKSVVSALTISNGVLHSGSWDGTIRLWSLSDHPLLTVLGEETPNLTTAVLFLSTDHHSLVAAHENGSLKIWRNDVFMKSIEVHDGAVLTVGMEGNWMFTSGWDKTVCVQELAGDEFQIEARNIGSIPCDSVITSFLYWQGTIQHGLVYTKNSGNNVLTGFSDSDLGGQIEDRKSHESHSRLKSCVRFVEKKRKTMVALTNEKSASTFDTGRVASVYSEVQGSRIDHALPLPFVLKNPFKIVDGSPSSAAGYPEEIAKLFPSLYGQPSAILVPNEMNTLPSDQKLKIGMVLSGGQAPGGHNVICGIFDYLQERAKSNIMYGFKGGPAGIMKGKYVELTSDFVYPYRNQGGFDMICSGRDKIETLEQFKQAEETAKKLDLDGLVVIGGDDSNKNACLLTENFKSKNLKARVIGCPKTIDGDLKCKEVPISFGFDTACKIYAEMIENVMTNARSTGKYYHFVRLMGRAASHITLECALQTHPNITIIGEEVYAKKQTLENVTDYMVDVICKRAESGYNYGVILIPEGLIDFIPEVQELIAELNEILAHDVVDEKGEWKKKLTNQSRQLFDFLPAVIQEQLMLERDPHGNVQVARIETEKMLIQMVETELGKRKQAGAYNGHFKGQSHFSGMKEGVGCLVILILATVKFENMRILLGVKNLSKRG